MSIFNVIGDVGGAIADVVREQDAIKSKQNAALRNTVLTNFINKSQKTVARKRKANREAEKEYKQLLTIGVPKNAAAAFVQQGVGKLMFDKAMEASKEGIPFSTIIEGMYPELASSNTSAAVKKDSVNDIINTKSYLPYSDPDTVDIPESIQIGERSLTKGPVTIDYGQTAKALGIKQETESKVDSPMVTIDPTRFAKKQTDIGKVLQATVLQSLNPDLTDMEKEKLDSQIDKLTTAYKKFRSLSKTDKDPLQKVDGFSLTLKDRHKIALRRLRLLDSEGLNTIEQQRTTDKIIRDNIANRDFTAGKLFDNIAKATQVNDVANKMSSDIDRILAKQREIGMHSEVALSNARSNAETFLSEYDEYNKIFTNNVKMVIAAEINETNKKGNSSLFQDGEKEHIRKRINKDVMSNADLGGKVEKYPVGSFFQFTKGGINDLYLVRKQIPANVKINEENFKEYFLLISRYDEFTKAFPISAK
tara:strand:- start:840 stop:2270 length:1431 start_codon:yes stop_codon:yes gene_type:complete